MLAEPPALAIIAPCYNEEEVLPISVPAFRSLLDRLKDAGKISHSSHLFLVDDGSSDATWSLIEQYAHDNADLKGLKLTRNRGHQNAVLAGMMEAEGDLLVSIDVDCQDDHNAIEDMVDAFMDEGAQIVYGVRSERRTDSVFKRVTAEGFYRFLRALGVEVVFNHADRNKRTREYSQ